MHLLCLVLFGASVHLELFADGVEGSASMKRAEFTGPKDHVQKFIEFRNAVSGAYYRGDSLSTVSPQWAPGFSQDCGATPAQTRRTAEEPGHGNRTRESNAAPQLSPARTGAQGAPDCMLRQVRGLVLRQEEAFG